MQNQNDGAIYVYPISSGTSAHFEANIINSTINICQANHVITANI